MNNQTNETPKTNFEPIIVYLPMDVVEATMDYRKITVEGEERTSSFSRFVRKALEGYMSSIDRIRVREALQAQAQAEAKAVAADA